MIATVEAERFGAEGRIDEIAVMGCGRIWMRIGPEEAAGGAHPLWFDGPGGLQSQNDLGESSLEQGMGVDIEAGQ